jgi:hypothetical protein
LPLVTLAALDPGAPQYFWKHIANVLSTKRTVAVDNVDAGSGTGSDNLFYTGNPGQLFNPGNGRGLPNMSQLAADFAG